MSHVPEMVIHVGNLSRLYPELDLEAWTVSPSNRVLAVEAGGIPGCKVMLGRTSWVDTASKDVQL